MYEYKGQKFTIAQLEVHEDCQVSGHDLRRNIWSKKYPIKKAMETPIPKNLASVKKTWHFMGLDLSLAELSELHVCKCTHWKLSQRLNRGEDINFAIHDKDTPAPPRPEKSKPLHVPEIARTSIASSTISFTVPTVRDNKRHTYEWLCLERFGMVMEKNWCNVEKTIKKKVDK